MFFGGTNFGFMSGANHITTNNIMVFPFYAPDVTSYMTHAPQQFPDVRTAVIAYLNTSFGELDRLYALDKATAFQPETATPEQKAFAAARLAAGAEMLRDLWYTAWVTSAVP